MGVPLVPMADYVVIEQEVVKTKTASGLYLPEKSADKPKIAKVLAVGKEVKDIKVGDRVVYGGYSNTEVTIDKTEYILVKEENIFAKVKA